MGQKDPRVDAYIEHSAEFARPILFHLRDLVHRGCPGVEETIKWSMPFFVHRGLLCHMAAFKRHAAFGFWRSARVLGRTEGREGMGQFGRITSLEDLPTDKVLLAHIRKAAEANEAGVKVPARTGFRSSEKPRLMVPDYFAAALKEDEQAQSNFERFSPSHKREYVEWVAGAKREETRQRRLRTAVAWIAQGKPQNWRYERC